MWEQLLSALALVMVLEGLSPALSPQAFRRWLITAAQMPDRVLRTVGLVSMLAGALLLHFLSG